MRFKVNIKVLDNLLLWDRRGFKEVGCVPPILGQISICYKVKPASLKGAPHILQLDAPL